MVSANIVPKRHARAFRATLQIPAAPARTTAVSPLFESNRERHDIEITETPCNLNLLLVEPDVRVAGDLTTFLLDNDSTVRTVVPVPSVAALAARGAEDNPSCVVVPLRLDSAADDDVMRAVREVVADLPVLALVVDGGAARGLRAVQHGADDFVVCEPGATGRLRHAVRCATERVRYRLDAGPSSVVWPDVVSELADGLLIVAGDGRVTSMNPAAARILGVEPADVLGRNLTELSTTLIRRDGTPITADQRPATRTLGSGQPLSATTIGVRDSSGAVRWTEVAGYPMHTVDGGIDYVVISLHDINARIAAEDALHALSAIVTSTADAVFSKSLDGTILSWNRGAADLYGYSEDEAVGRKVDMLQPRDAPDQVGAILETIAAGGAVRDLETVRRRRDGSHVHVSLTVSPVRGPDGSIVGASVIGRDITDRKQLEEQLANLATHDALTGLPNRLLLHDRIEQALAAATRRGTCVAVLMLDLDHFGRVNARHGYPVGDGLLDVVAQRLCAVAGDGDTVARLSGDKFVLVSEATRAEATTLAARAGRALELPAEMDGMSVRTSACIGIAMAPPLAPDADRLVGLAQTAVNEAKATGRGQCRVFDASTQRRADERQQTSEDLAVALATGALEVHYQPVVEIVTGRLMGIEALARWLHPTQGWVAPTEFVALAEDAGFVAALDAYVLEQACADAAKLRAWGALPDDGYVAVNVSARNLGDGGLVDRVCQVAADARWPLDSLELEVTETALMGDTSGARTALERLREMGVGVALDDFGTGYSSLTYLRQLPISTIKIDRAFVQYMTTRSEDLAITASIVDLGIAVDVRTVAEGVETVEQLALLKHLGCGAGQGFLWSPALSRDDFAQLMRTRPDGFQPVPPTPNIRWKARHGGAQVTNEHGLHRIWQLHRDGASLITIAAALNAGGFRTPAGQRWHGTSVASVIAYAPGARAHVSTAASN